MIKCILILCLFLNVNCLYEDQIGNWDWKQSYIGKIKYFHALSLSKSQTNLIGSESNVVSSIYLRNGTIKWRMALESKGSLQAFAIDDEQNGFSIDEYSDKELITINNDGLFVRSWQPVTGSLNWEKRLPEKLLKHKDEKSLINFLINPKKNEIVISKLYPTNDAKLILCLYAYDYLKNEIVKREKQTLNHQLTDLSTCKLVSSTSLVCLNAKNSTLNHYSFNQINSNEQLSSFGFKADVKSLEINELDYQTNEVNPMFTLNLGKDGFALIQLIDHKFKLMKIFTNIDCLTLKKVNIDGISKTFAFVLMPKPATADCELKNGEPNCAAATDDEANSDLHQFKVTAFDLIEWNEIKQLQEHFILKYKSSLLIDKFYILPFNKAQDKYQFKIVLSTKDASFILISSKQGSGKTNWIREEALSSIISAEIIDYPLNELDAEIESLDLSDADTIYEQFLKRIKSQINQLQTLTCNFVSYLNELISTHAKESKDLNDNLNLDFALYEDDDQVSIRDKFGFHKLIVVLTKYGKLLGIDTLKGKLIWSLNDETLYSYLQDYLKEEEEYDENKKISINIQRTTSHHPFQAIGTIALKNGYILSIDLIKGEVISRKQLSINLKQMILLSHLDSNNLKGLLLFDETNTAHFYPPSVYEEVFLNHKDKYYLVTGNKKTGVIEGYSFSNLDQTNRKATKIWSINIPISSIENNMKIIFKNSFEQVHSLGRVLGKFKIYL